MCSAKMLFHRPVRDARMITLACGVAVAVGNSPDEAQLAERQLAGQPRA